MIGPGFNTAVHPHVSDISIGCLSGLLLRTVQLVTKGGGGAVLRRGVSVGGAHFYLRNSSIVIFIDGIQPPIF